MNHVKKRSVIIAGHKTSISLEEPFWEELAKIAATKKLSVNSLIEEIDRSREGNLSSAIRLLVIEELRHQSSS